MGSHIVNRSFARLFKKYRLRSEIDTLTQFGDLLAEEGYIYENSIFTHWQKGTRIPHDRRVILCIIRLFSKKNAISTLEEANNILESLGMRDLTVDEVAQLFGASVKYMPFIVPADIEYFTGRNELIRRITTELIRNNSVILYGQPGSGKSSLSIHIAHLLKSQFSDGILYYRFDIIHKEDILLDIGRKYGLDISKEVTLENKAKTLSALLKNKKVLIIFDNLDSYDELQSFFKTHKYPCVIMVTTRTVPPRNFQIHNSFNVKGFTKDELSDYARSILGNAYWLSNIEKIIELGNIVEFSPLLLGIIFKHIEQDPESIDYFLKKLDVIPLQTAYDKKTIDSSLKLSFDKLTSDVQDIFISLGIFHGSDFAPNVVAFINHKSVGTTKAAFRELYQFSLLEFSVHDRYRLHPLIRLYIQKKIDEKKYCERLADYYLNIFTKNGVGNSSNYSFIVEELDNVTGIISLCFRYGFYKQFNNLWKYIGVFFWDTGRWNKLNLYGQMDYESNRNFKNKELYVTLFIFIILTLVWIYGYFNLNNNENISSIFSYTYTLVAIWGGILGLSITRRWGGLQSQMAKSIAMFSIGLLFQSFGQVAYGYYMLLYYPNKFTYPSIGDIGYFGSIFFYIYGSLLILRVAKTKIYTLKLKHKIISILIPMFLLLTSYLLFLNGYKPDWSQPIRIVLDFAYPLGQSVYLIFALLAFAYSRLLSTGLLKQRIRLIILALVAQFIADYVFLFALSNNLTKPGDIVDYLYLFAYFLMTCAIIQFRSIYGLPRKFI